MTFFLQFWRRFYAQREKSVFVLFLGKTHVQNERKVSFPVYS